VKEVVAWQLAEAMRGAEDFQEQDGDFAVDRPYWIGGRVERLGDLAGTDERYYAGEFAAGGGDGWAAGFD
jgi:hypothetical protein